jgi:TM2 domain-containing membrane protein YozV
MSKHYKAPKSSWLMRLFWKAAGADRYILERSTYGDQIKYFCLGGIVVATGFMAGLAGGYAFYTIFEPRDLAIYGINTTENIESIGYIGTDTQTAILAALFGIIWGLIIFNIDRFIVTSTGRGDGTEKITAQEFRSAIPRIIMGMIIAISISKPVEIRMFKSEIDVALYTKQVELRQEYQDKVNVRFETLIDEANARVSDLKAEIKEKTAARDSVLLLYNLEITKGGRRGERPDGIGPVARALKDNLNHLNMELDRMIDEYRPNIQEEEENIRKYKAQREEELALSNQKAAGLDGLLERIKLAHEIAGVWITLFITLLFMAVELTPIFFKLMLTKSTYDYLEDNIKEIIKAENGIEIKYEYYKGKEGTEKDLVIFHQAERLRELQVDSIKAQYEVNLRALEEWKNEQISKMRNDSRS